MIVGVAIHPSSSDQPVPKARWSEDELKSHHSSGLTTKGTPGTWSEHQDRNERNFPGATGRQMMRLVFREDEARPGGTC